MATDPKTKLGKITCNGFNRDGSVCGQKSLFLDLNESTQTVSFKCMECGNTGYAKKGEHHREGLLSRLKAEGNPAPAPGPVPEPTPAPPSPPKKKEASWI